MAKPPKLHDVLISEGFEARYVDYKNMRSFVDYLQGSEEVLRDQAKRGFLVLPVRDCRETAYFIYTKPSR